MCLYSHDLTSLEKKITNLVEGVEPESRERARHEHRAEDEDGQAAHGVAEDAGRRRGQQLCGVAGRSSNSCFIELMHSES